jgi:hypothetical protein
MAVREVERAVERGQVTSGQRSRYQAVALLARQERTRIRSATDLTDTQRDAQLKRLDGIAAILAQTAAREPSFMHLLGDDAEIGAGTRLLLREMQEAAGFETQPEEAAPAASSSAHPERTVIPRSVAAAQLANPFQVPEYVPTPRVQGRLDGWELIGPLLNAFEHPVPGAVACMELPEPRPLTPRRGPDL